MTRTLADSRAGTSAASPAPAGSWSPGILVVSTSYGSSAFRLPTDPLLPTWPAFLLPDRHGLLDAIDDHPTRCKGLGTVRRRADDGNGAVADHELSEAMADRHGRVAVLLLHVVDDEVDLLLGHR